MAQYLGPKGEHTSGFQFTDQELEIIWWLLQHIDGSTQSSYYKYIAVLKSLLAEEAQSRGWTTRRLDSFVKEKVVRFVLRYTAVPDEYDVFCGIEEHNVLLLNQSAIDILRWILGRKIYSNKTHPIDEIYCAFQRYYQSMGINAIRAVDYLNEEFCVECEIHFSRHPVVLNRR